MVSVGVFPFFLALGHLLGGPLFVAFCEAVPIPKDCRRSFFRLEDDVPYIWAVSRSPTASPSSDSCVSKSMVSFDTTLGYSSRSLPSLMAHFDDPTCFVTARKVTLVSA